MLLYFLHVFALYLIAFFAFLVIHIHLFLLLFLRRGILWHLSCSTCVKVSIFCCTSPVSKSFHLTSACPHLIFPQSAPLKSCDSLSGAVLTVASIFLRKLMALWSLLANGGSMRTSSTIFSSLLNIRSRILSPRVGCLTCYVRKQACTVSRNAWSRASASAMSQSNVRWLKSPTIMQCL